MASHCGGHVCVGRRRATGDLVRLDVGAAGVFVLLTFLGAFGTSAGDGWSTAIAMLVTAVPAAFRRVWPVPVFAVVLIGPAAVLAVHPGPGPLLCLGWALCPVTLRIRRRRGEPTVLVAALSVVVLLGGAMSGSIVASATPAPLMLIGVLALGGSWTRGRLVAGRRSMAAQVARPEEVLDALAVIGTSTREAIAEMRRMLGALRAEPSAGDLLPQPGPQSLKRLAHQAEVAGVVVELAVDGMDVVPPGLWPSVYRLV